MNVSPPVAGAFVAYLLAVAAIGLWAWRRTRDLSDYILGGRRLGRWVTALSAGASDMSGWLLLGLPGYAYVAGLEAGWIALGLLAGTWANWRFMAARLRRYSELADDSLTLPDFLEARFADGRRLLRVTAALMILFFFFIYTASGLVAGGKLFATVFGLDYHQAVLAGAAAILVYTLVGGFLAVSWTDLLQGLLMAAALVVVPAVALSAAGGVEAVARAMAEKGPALLEPLTDRHGQALGVAGLLSLLGWGLGYFGQPHILARFKAAASERELPAARRIAVTWVALSLAGALAAGWTGIAWVRPPLEGAASERVFLVLVENLLPGVLAGMALAAVLAAIMSTADSQLLVCASALTEDFYRALVRPRAGPRELVWMGRGAVLAVTLGAAALAWDPDRRVLDLVAYAWAGFGAAFGPPLLLSLYWRRMNATGALAGMVAGAVTVVAWRQGQGGIFALYEIIPGVLVSALAVVAGTLLGPAPPAAVTARFDAVHRGG